MKKLFKKILSVFPITFSTWVYTTLLPRPLRNLADTFIKSGIPEQIQIEEGILCLNKNDVGVSGILAMGIYEPYETSIIRKHIHAGMNVIDIGANIGFYSVIAGKRVGPQGKVFSFEPEPENFSILSKNITVNGFTHVIASQVALSDVSGTSKLFLTEGNKGTHSLADNRNTRNSVTVSTKTLDEVVAAHGSPRIDIIKMDIEGAEIKAIEGMQQTISRSPKLTLFTEFYPKAIIRLGGSPIGYLNRLKELGFVLSVINENAQKVEPLNDFEAFVKSISMKGEVARNLLAVKE